MTASLALIERWFDMQERDATLEVFSRRPSSFAQCLLSITQTQVQEAYLVTRAPRNAFIFYSLLSTK
jgi:hypothetical protein